MILNFKHWISPIVVFLIILIASYFVERMLLENSLQQHKVAAIAELATLRAKLEGTINGNLLLVRGLIAEVATNPRIDQQEYSLFVSQMMSTDTELRNIAAAPNLVVSLMHPLEGNEAAIGLNYRTHPKQREAALRVVEEDKLVVAGPVNLIQGGQGFIARAPVYTAVTDGSNARGEFWGLVSAVIDLETFYRNVGIYDFNPSLEIAIRGIDGKGADGGVFYGRASLFDASPILTDVTFPGGNWQIGVTPRGGWESTASLVWPVRITGLLIALLTGLILIQQNTRQMERDLAATSLHQIKDHLQTLHDTSPDMIFLHAEDGRVVDVNDNVCQTFGYSRDEILNIPFEKLMGEGFSIEKAGEHINQVLSGNKLDFEWVSRKKSGKEFPVEVSLRLLQGNDLQSDARVLAIVRDISQRKIAEKALKTSVEKYQGIFDESVAAIYVFDGEKNFIDSNQAGLDLLGYSRKELFNLAISDVDADPDAVIPAHNLLLGGGRINNYEHRLIRKDGKFITVLNNSRSLTTADGAIMGMQSTLLDITERKRIEEALRESEHKYRSLMEHSPLSIQQVSPEGITLSVNRAWEKLWGVPLSALENYNMLQDKELIKQGIMPAIKRAFAGEVVEISAHEYNKANQSEVPDQQGKLWVRTFMYPLYGDDNQLHEVVLIQEDISDRKAAENAQFEKQKAEATAQAKSQFLANMSHEIRTPLNGVLGLARMGESGLKPEKIQETFALITDSGEHLLRVVNDILDFSKIEAGMLVVESQPFKLMVSVENVTNLVSEQAKAKELLLNIDVSPDIPLWVKGDKMRLEQILLNLLSNAIKFSELSEIQIQVNRKATDILFCVTDSGIGITEEQLERLFTPFEQADTSTTRRFGGTGLGLAISAKLAQLMNGEINVQSRPGEGSTFILRLPLPEVTPPSKPVTVNAEQTSGTQLKGVHILAAEDIEINRMILEDLLENEGAHVVFAENGQLALDYLTELGVNHFDLILMDIQMPVMDGFEATHQILEIAPGLPVIGLTAHALAEEREKCLTVGMVEHVSKPIDPDTLFAAILRHIDLPASHSSGKT